MFIFRIKKPWKHLAIMNKNGSNALSAEETIVDVDADAVLVAVVTDAILFAPASG